MDDAAVATDVGRSVVPQAARYRRLQIVAFVLFCLLLAAMTAGTLRANALWSWTTPDVWGLTALGWVLLDLALAVLFALLVVGPRLALIVVALGLVAIELLFQLFHPIIGRYSGAMAVAALLVAGLVAFVLSGWNVPRPRSRLLARPVRLFAVVFAILSVATIATSLLAWHHYEAPFRTYASSPDGRWTLVATKGGSQDYFPSLDVARNAWGLFRDVRPLCTPYPTQPPRWLDDHTVDAFGNSYDVRHDDWTPI